MICGPALNFGKKVHFQKLFMRNDIPQHRVFGLLGNSKGHSALSHKPFMFAPISFCLCPSNRSFSETFIKQLLNLYQFLALVPVSLHLPQVIVSLLQPPLKAQVRLSPSISILLLIPRLPSDHCQEKKRT